jgi:hypothetical protein
MTQGASLPCKLDLIGLRTSREQVAQHRLYKDSQFCKAMSGEEWRVTSTLSELQIDDAARQLREAILNVVSRHHLRVKSDI